VSDTITLPDVNAALTALDGSDAARSVIVFG